MWWNITIIPIICVVSVQATVLDSALIVLQAQDSVTSHNVVFHCLKTPSLCVHSNSHPSAVTLSALVPRQVVYSFSEIPQ